MCIVRLFCLFYLLDTQGMERFQGFYGIFRVFLGLGGGKEKRPTQGGVDHLEEDDTGL
jgi:hypothetical protein